MLLNMFFKNTNFYFLQINKVKDYRKLSKLRFTQQMDGNLGSVYWKVICTFDLLPPFFYHYHLSVIITHFHFFIFEVFFQLVF